MATNDNVSDPTYTGREVQDVSEKLLYFLKDLSNPPPLWPALGCQAPGEDEVN